MFLATSLIAYSLILHSQTLRRHSIQSHTSGDTDTVRRTFYVSFSVTVSFVVFYLVPNYIPHAENVLYETICIAVTYCGLAVDPVLYILLHSVLRPIAYRLFTCKGLFAGRGTVSSITTITTINGNLIVSPPCNEQMGSNKSDSEIQTLNHEKYPCGKLHKETVV